MPTTERLEPLAARPCIAAATSVTEPRGTASEQSDGRAARRHGRATGGLLGAALLALTVCGCASTMEPHPDPSAGNGVFHRDDRHRNSGSEDEPPALTAEEARSHARQAVGAGDLDTALYMFAEAASLDSDDVESLYSIGAIHENKGNLELAARAYRRVVAIDPSHALAQQQLGTLELRGRDLEAAKQSLEAAIEADPSLWRPHNLLGVIADMEERYSDAIDHYSAAIALKPSAPSIINNRGYSKYLNGMLEAAEADFLLTLELDASFQYAWQNLGLVYARQHKYHDARWAMEMYMPKHVAANDVGYIAMLNGDYDAAALLFEEAIRLSPRYYPTARENLAELEARSSGEQVLVVESASSASSGLAAQASPDFAAPALPTPSSPD